MWTKKVDVWTQPIKLCSDRLILKIEQKKKSRNGFARKQLN